VKSARQEFRQPASRVATGPTTGFTLTNLMLIVLVAVYVLEAVRGGVGAFISGPSTRVLIDMGANVGVLVAAGETWRLFTSMFLHVGIFHILMNGYALYLFGNIVETETGRLRFLGIYFIGGLFASAASYMFGSAIVPSAGASGAIFALFGAFFGYSWRRRHLAFYAARVRSAVTLIAINMVFSIAVPGIDWHAHAGGLVAGGLLGLAFDGFGTTASRKAAFAATAVALVVLGALLVGWRTEQLQPLVQQFGLA
jgi:rhomboid protease GluP